MNICQKLLFKSPMMYNGPQNLLTNHVNYQFFNGLFRQKTNWEILQIEPTSSQSKVKQALNSQLNELRGENQTSSTQAQIQKYQEAYQAIMIELTEKQEAKAKSSNQSLSDTHQQSVNQPVNKDNSQTFKQNLPKIAKTIGANSFREKLESKKQSSSDHPPPPSGEEETKKSTQKDSNQQESHNQSQGEENDSNLSSAIFRIFAVSITGVIFGAWAIGNLLKDQRRDVFEANQIIKDHPYDKMLNPQSYLNEQKSQTAKQEPAIHNENFHQQEIHEDQYADKPNWVIEQVSIKKNKN